MAALHRQDIHGASHWHNVFDHGKPAVRTTLQTSSVMMRINLDVLALLDISGAMIHKNV